MVRRQIGKTSLWSSVLGYGTSHLASLSTGLTTRQAVRLVHVSLDLGINLIDTSDSYGRGRSEEVIGKALKGRRRDCIISSKAGYSFTPLGRATSVLAPLYGFSIRRITRLRRTLRSVRSKASQMNMLVQRFSPAYIQTALEASLRRLQTDRIDLFFLHDPPLSAIMNEDLIRQLDTFQQSGKIRYFGVSSPDGDILRASLDLPALAVVQTPVNPATLPMLASVLPDLAKRGIGTVANQPFLSGSFFASDPDIADISKRVHALASTRRCSDRRLLIQLPLVQPSVATVLCGTTNSDHLRTNVADVLGDPVASLQDFALALSDPR